AKQELADLTQGEHGGNAGAIAHDMQQRATDIEHGERVPNNAKAQAARHQDKVDSAAWDHKMGDAKAPAKQAGDAVERAQKQLDDHTAELAKNKDEQRHLEDKATANENEARRLGRIAQDARGTEEAMETAPEAMGTVLDILAWVVGLGDSYKRFK